MGEGKNRSRRGKNLKGATFLYTMLDACSNRGTKHEMGEHLLNGTVSLKKRGPRRLSPYPSLISILEFAICLVGKAHVTKLELSLNFFPLGFQIPQISYCIFKKPVICTNLITCSAKLSLHAAECGQLVL